MYPRNLTTGPHFNKKQFVIPKTCVVFRIEALFSAGSRIYTTIPLIGNPGGRFPVHVPEGQVIVFDIHERRVLLGAHRLIPI